MTQRRWTPTGVIVPTPVRLSSEQRKSIANGFRAKAEEASDEFYSAVELALGRYHSSSKAYRATSPSAVRNNLAMAHQVARSLLNDHLNDFDHNSIRLLDEARGGGIEGLRAKIADVMKHLAEAEELAMEYPSRGRLPDFARLYLAVDVAVAIDDYTTATPNAKPDGVFACVIDSVLGSASAPLMKRALAVRVVRHEGGLVEYLPPEN